MKLAHIWYNEDERDLIRTLIESQEPSWYFETIWEHEVSSLVEILEILNADYTAILVHLSFEFCLALKMAEICHRDNNPTKVILFSRTRADHTLLTGFFDGIIHPDDDISHLTSTIKVIIDEERTVIKEHEELDRRIIAIFNRSSSLKSHFRMVSGLRHKESFDLDDYRAAINASVQQRTRKRARIQTQNTGEISLYEKRLQLLREQKAMLGINADPAIQIEIEWIESTLNKLYNQLGTEGTNEN